MPAPLIPLTALFQPQAWQNDYAIDIDGKTDFDAAPVLLAMSADELKFVDRQMNAPHGRDLDIVAYRSGVIGSHNGPYVVTFDQDAYRGWLRGAGFDPDRMSQVTDEKMEAVRAAFGIEAMPPETDFGPNP